MSLLDIVPAERRGAAKAALEAAFDGAALTDLQPVTGGASGALIFRANAVGRCGLLRMERPADRLRDPARHYACLRIAAEAGVAPALRFADAETCVSVTDFIEARPLSEHPGGAEGLATALGALTARLQGSPAFPPLAPYPMLLKGMFAHVRDCGLFAPGLLDPHAEALDRLIEAYPWGAEPAVASHNDPNLRNVLFDGARLWLIDWETAYANDRFVDIAIHADQLQADEALSGVLLRAWLGRPAGEAETARLAIMRPLTRACYAMLLLAISSASPPARPSTDLTAMDPGALQAAVISGELGVGEPRMMFELGKLMLAGFLLGASDPATKTAMAGMKRAAGLGLGSPA